MIAILYIWFVLLAISFLLYWRNKYTYGRQIYAIRTIFNYLLSKIDDDTYEMDRDYYDEMMISDNRYLLSFWLYGKYSAIKKEYVDIVKPFSK